MKKKEMNNSDKEWVDLILEARKDGLSLEEIREFFESYQNREKKEKSCRFIGR